MSDTSQKTPPTPDKSKDVRLLFLVLCAVSLLLAVFLYRFDHPEEFRRSAEKVREAAESVSKGIPVVLERVGDFAEYVLDYHGKPIETLPLVLPEKFEYVDGVSDTGSTIPEENEPTPNSSWSSVPPIGDVNASASDPAQKSATATGIVIRVGWYEIELKGKLPKGEKASFSVGEASFVVGMSGE